MVEVDSDDLATTTATTEGVIPVTPANVAHTVVTIEAAAVAITVEIPPQDPVRRSNLITAMRSTMICVTTSKTETSDLPSTSAFKTARLLKRGINPQTAKMRIYGMYLLVIGLRLPEIQRNSTK